MEKIVPQGAVLIPKQAERVFKGVIYDTYQWQQKLFDGSETTFEMLRRPDTVSAIGVVGNKIVVIDDNQPHRGNRLSFPGGRVDEKDGGTLTAAQREMHEETGYEFQNWRLAQVWQPQTKIEWFIYLFIAWDGAKTAEPHVDAGEKVGIKLLPFEKVKELVLAKTGYLGESEALFANINSLQELLGLPEFEGKEYGDSTSKASQPMSS